jgi:deferrochelatase/peroxidase EfeB
MADAAGVSRRNLLGAAAAGGLTVGVAGGFGLGRGTADGDGDSIDSSYVPFYGRHQAGIITPAQDRLHFAAFDVTTSSRSELVDLLKTWSQAAAAMATGDPAGHPNKDQNSPPKDTGEAFDLPAASLTITFGFGRSLFDERFGLRRKRPAALEEIPPLPGDELDPEISGGDICVQACADDPQVAFHAVRNLARLGQGVVVMRWCQLGFGRTSKTSSTQQTPRNLMGFKDGTNNITAQQGGDVNRFVWVGNDGPAWMRGGSYLVSRRIRMLIEPWDRTALSEQESIFGRDKYEGAALGQSKEKDRVDLKISDADGKPLIPATAHIRLAAPSTNKNERILRRGYSFTDGFDQVRGQLDAGLFFICFQRDPRKQFVPIQTRLAAKDGLNEYIQHKSSAVFAVAPGARRRGDWVGSGLFS